MTLHPPLPRDDATAAEPDLRVELRAAPVGWAAELSYGRHARKLHFASLAELMRYLSRLGRRRSTRGLR